jgi:hypothetical protein
VVEQPVAAIASTTATTTGNIFNRFIASILYLSDQLFSQK